MWGQYNVLSWNSALASKRFDSTDSRYGEPRIVIPSSKVTWMALTIASEHTDEFSLQKFTIL